jgi:hypothetical protein
LPGSTIGGVKLPLFPREQTVLSSAAASSMRSLLLQSIDLQSLYQRASRESEPGMRTVLEENLYTLDLLVVELRQHCNTGHATGVRGTWRGSLHGHVTTWLTRCASHRDLAWIRVLAYRESALLQAFQASIASLPSEQVSLLQRQLPRLHGIHLDMHHLAGSASR